MGIARATAAVILALAALPADAATTRQEEQTCPIDGEKFTATLATSGYMRGRFLDGKPYGSILAPPPIPKCPTSGFVVYKRTFTEDELTRLRAFVATPAYRAAAAQETTHYLLALLLEHMGAPKRSIAYARLLSTWQAADGEQYRRYAGEALEAHKAALAAGLPPKLAVELEMATGELERRLGRFDEARERFGRLAEREEVKGNFLADLVRQELALIEAKDAAPHHQHGAPAK